MSAQARSQATKGLPGEAGARRRRTSSASGATGAITGIGNVLPREVLQLVELSKQAAKGDAVARRRALELTRKKMDPAERFTKNDERELEYLTAKSNVDSEELSEALEEEVAQELLDDDESDFEEEDRDNPSDVVYVSYTEPVTAEEYAANPDEPWNDHTVDDMIAAEEAAARESEGGSTKL